MSRFLTLFVIGFFISLPTLLPLFRSNFFHLHDYTHVARLVELDTALKDGHFPVRWSKHLGFGYGLPQFNFYAPLPYYIAEVFHLVGFSPLWSIKLLVIFNFLLSFVFMYLATRKQWGFWGALVSATAFVYIPYRAVDFYVRGALGELTAITFLAGSLWALLKFIEKRNMFWVGTTSLLLGALLTSHNLVALMGFPALFGFAALLLLLHKAPAASWFKLMMIFVLGVGIGSFYAIPALLEKQYTQVDILTSGFSNYNHHFLYWRQFFHSKWAYGGSILGPDDDLSFEVGKIHILLGVLAGIAWLFKSKNLQFRWIIPVSGLVIVVSLALATFKTKPFWDAIPLIAYIQFPWRFLSIVMVFASFLAGAIFLFIPRLSHRILLAPVLIVVLMTTQAWMFQPVGYLDNNDALYYTEPKKITDHMSAVIPDFMPRTKVDITSINPQYTRFELLPQPQTYEVIIDKTHYFKVKTASEHDFTFRANIAEFPGWTLYLNGEKMDFVREEDFGTMLLHVPAGEHILEGRFEETPVRAVTNVISLISLAVAGGLVWWKRAHAKS